jgi:hypothetical protein
MPFIKGHANTKLGGRKKKDEDLKITNVAIESIEEKYGSLKNGFLALLDTKEPSLIKFVFEHAAGKPKEKVDVNMNNETETVQIIQLPFNGRSSGFQSNSAITDISEN